jgi:hypothetical protein
VLRGIDRGHFSANGDLEGWEECDKDERARHAAARRAMANGLGRRGTKGGELDGSAVALALQTVTRVTTHGGRVYRQGQRGMADQENDTRKLHLWLLPFKFAKGPSSHVG